jgi:uncharacterized membrane protein
MVLIIVVVFKIEMEIVRGILMIVMVLQAPMAVIIGSLISISKTTEETMMIAKTTECDQILI